MAGPFLVSASRSLAEGWGADPDVAPWLVLAAAALAGAGLVAALRPDPSDLAAERPRGPAGPRRPPSRLLRVASFRVALLVTAVSQMSMVGIMGVAPVVIHHHGGGSLLVSSAISLHLVGMYAFSPAFGWLVDRAGRRAGLALGGGVSAAGALLAAGLQGGALVAVGLFLVGLGWSAAYVSVTAVVSDVTEPHERAGGARAGRPRRERRLDRRGPGRRARAPGGGVHGARAGDGGPAPPHRRRRGLDPRGPGRGPRRPGLG